MQVADKDGDVELNLSGDVAKEEIEATYASCIINNFVKFGIITL